MNLPKSPRCHSVLRLVQTIEYCRADAHLTRSRKVVPSPPSPDRNPIDSVLHSPSNQEMNRHLFQDRQLFETQWENNLLVLNNRHPVPHQIPRRLQRPEAD